MRSRPSRSRLDLLVVRRGLAESHSRAEALIRLGAVRVEGTVVTKPGTPVPEEADLSVAAPGPYVSRGGIKLAHALKIFGVDPAGKTAVDVGASTGGFTDVLLQAGAARVFAVDVGYGQLAEKLRRDPRVVILDRRNIRHLDPKEIGVPVDLAVIDVSFISLAKVLPKAAELLGPAGEGVVLVKPQFEVGRGLVGEKGVVKSEAAREEAVEGVIAAAKALGFFPAGIEPSPITGPEGNIEIFVHLKRKGTSRVGGGVGGARGVPTGREGSPKAPPSGQRAGGATPSHPLDLRRSRGQSPTLAGMRRKGVEPPSEPSPKIGERSRA